MMWDKALLTLSVAFSAASLCFMLYCDFRIWRAQKRLIKAKEEYAAALDKAIAQLKANPTAWLDHMGMMDDKRRMN